MACFAVNSGYFLLSIRVQILAFLYGPLDTGIAELKIQCKQICFIPIIFIPAAQLLKDLVKERDTGHDTFGFAVQDRDLISIANDEAAIVERGNVLLEPLRDKGFVVGSKQMRIVGHGELENCRTVTLIGPRAKVKV